ncbi:Serine/threonine-protein kinase PrkC [Aquisphaera giovannonii]|uniref:Serine/threonine-protein kinase PrkC n=1 Tax=Aquisphaera giovannonii TaxID=406548 RepID=A0A5B9W3Q6_9BACT|nr:serine/threonine-protein kinase [Aquisphaera giovannonii]QEH34819.1 Serine/threonine-protein kinase PrkC [Aquisphaera giovannonii]
MPEREQHDDGSPSGAAGRPRAGAMLSGSHSGLDGQAPALVELVEETTRRLLEGEEVDLDRLAAEHPDWADLLRGLMPAMQGLADLRDGDGAVLPGDGPATDEDATFAGFRIVREVGRGGVGVVYEAEQVALRRRVALKILPQSSALDPRALRRFQLEAQVAGWLQHPRIVPVHDVGLVRGVPYYAMPLIEGGSLADLLAELRELEAMPGQPDGEPSAGRGPGGLLAGLLASRSSAEGGAGAAPSPGAPASPLRSPAYFRAVAELGMQAAEALGYAHDRGVIHRDIKPANLLIDRRGELWIADFGMADVQGEAGVTITGDLPGTLRYMSPEQALGKRALIDRRTDIYSLGVTLFEMLTLRPAVSGEDRQEILRRVAEEETPSPRRLNPAVPPDLVTIVARATAKDPSNRYETAWRLAEDLDRFLGGRPILARPVGPIARAWRWCRRKPALAGLAGSLAASVVVVLVAVTWSWREALRQRDLVVAAELEARGQAAKAAAINRFLIEGLLERAEPASNPAASRVTLSEALDRAARTVGTSFLDQPDVEAAIQLAIGRAYHGLGEYFKSEAHYRAAHNLLQGIYGPGPAERLEAASGLGHVLSHLGRWEEAERLLRPTLDDARRLLGRPHGTSLAAAENLAEVLRATGRLDEAEALYRDSLDDARLAPGLDPEIRFSARFNLGDVYLRQRRFAEAEALYRDLLEEQSREKGPEHPDTLTTRNNLGTTLEKLDRLEEAERIFRDCLGVDRRVLGDHHPDTATAMYNLGHVLRREGRLEEAEPLMRRSVAERRQSYGAEHPATLYITSGLAELLMARGEADEAVALLRPCLDAQARVLGRGHRDTMLTAGRLEALTQIRARLAPRDADHSGGMADR